MTTIASRMHVPQPARTPSPASQRRLKLRREILIPAIAVRWNSNRVYVRCPFPSCGKIHGHEYTEPEPWQLNGRLSHCDKNPKEYRILFPFEEDEYSLGLGVELDREKLEWRTVGDDFQGLNEDNAKTMDANQRNDTELEDLRTAVSGMGLNDLTEQEMFFMSFAINNDLEDVGRLLQMSCNPERLISVKDYNGNNAVALVCMEGHKDMVKFLVKAGADKENINSEGKTPLMISLEFGHGSIAELLILEGASTSVKDANGSSIHQMAKQTLKQMEELEWTHHGLPNESAARRSQREHNRICFSNIIDSCEAREKALAEIKRRQSKPKNQSKDIDFVKTSNGPYTQITVVLESFKAPIASPTKTFGYLDRGEAYEKVCAASGYTKGELGGRDDCLDRETWTKRVFVVCESVGHDLRPSSSDRDKRPGSYWACHAEKQLMAYFLWKHTTRYMEPGDGALEDLAASSPSSIGAKPLIYVNNEKVCGDCKKFKGLVKDRIGIDFDIRAISRPILRE